MYAFLNLYQRPDIIEAIFKKKGFSQEEIKIIKDILQENLISLEINIGEINKHFYKEDNN